MAANKIRFVSGAIVVLLAGCQSAPKSAPNAPATSVLPDSRVVLDPPVITFDHGNIEISGTLHRTGYNNGFLTGRIDVEFVNADGEILDELPVPFTPKNIPTDSRTPAEYHSSYGFIPPKGSTLRLHFVDGDTMVREDLEGGTFEAGGTGGGAGGAARAVGGAGNTHSGHTGYWNNSGGGFGSNFGSHNLNPNGGHH